MSSDGSGLESSSNNSRLSLSYTQLRYIPNFGNALAHFTFLIDRLFHDFADNSKNYVLAYKKIVSTRVCFFFIMKLTKHER